MRLLDLLDEPGDDRFDLVTGIEVLEHIEDDRLAAAHARVLASRFVYQLLPGCSERALDDPDARSAGIEVLVAVGELPSSSPERPRWDDRPMPRFPRARLVRGQVERVADAVDRRIVRRR